MRFEIKKQRTQAMALKRTALFAPFFALAAAAVVVISAMSVMAASTTQVVTPSNTQGWLFNPDPTTTTDYEFTEETSSLGAGSLYVLPIGTDNRLDKFIAAKELKVNATAFSSLSYDFRLGDGAAPTDAKQFYLNVYATVGKTDKFYDCRYDFVPMTGSSDAFTTFNVNRETTPTTVVRSGSSTATSCPQTLGELGQDWYIRAVTLNVGDTSLNDAGVSGYYDNVRVVTVQTDVTYDFELRPVAATTKQECKDGGWKSFQAGYKNQGQCVADVTANSNSRHN